jgi:sulfur carrier protein ThiS adenylyltransferase
MDFAQPDPTTNLPNPPLLSERALRQRDLVPPERLAACEALVVGIGAIGRQVALQLAAMGVPRLSLYDPDTVEEVNLAVQGYAPDQLGVAKVAATAADCRRLNPQMHILPHAERFRRSTALPGPQRPNSRVVFACVDSIATRRLVWEALRHQAALFVDGRMSAEVLRVLAGEAPATDRHYPTSLFAADEAYAGSCTARSTIYTAAIAAGLMLSQMTRWLRRLPLERDLTLNLLSTELTVAGESVM